MDPSGYNWFADRLFFYAIVTLNIVHGGFPFVAVTVLAGLMTVPKELREAGEAAWVAGSVRTEDAAVQLV
jgi:N,N'-diacetylchitobiose transport system permease protein